VTLASLAFGIYSTLTEPAIAYFSTPVRAWEFGFGALLAFIPSLVSRFWQPTLSILGFLGIIAAEKKKADDEVKAQVQCFGAGARAPGKVPCSNPKLKGVFPALSSAATDGYWPDKCGITARDDAKPVACQVGSIKASIRIAMVGDSHAKHYTAAFADLAKSNNWSVEV